MIFTINSNDPCYTRGTINSSKVLQEYLKNNKQLTLTQFAEQIASVIRNREIDLSVCEEDVGASCTFCELICEFIEDEEILAFVNKNKDVINEQTRAAFYCITQFDIDSPHLTRLSFDKDSGWAFGVDLANVDEDILFEIFGDDIFDKLDDGCAFDDVIKLSFKKLDRLVDFEEEDF